MSFSVVMGFAALGLIWWGIYKVSRMVARGTGKVLGAAGNIAGNVAGKAFPELVEEASRLGRTASVPQREPVRRPQRGPERGPNPANPWVEPSAEESSEPAPTPFVAPEGFGQRAAPQIPQGEIPSFLQHMGRGKSRKPFVQSPPSAPPASQLPVSQLPVSEQVTAVLRRQVPPRAETPRSWLGGLPMMPAHVEWPCGVNSDEPDRGKQPLHFLAQIACEDLPPDLWASAGPRTGWLLFFVSANSCCPDSKDERAVIHIEELGEERAPPADSAPVHDRVYTGGSYSWLADDAVPAHWRRWPVDVTVMENRLYGHEDSYPSASPENLAQILYEGHPVSPEERPSGLPTLRALTYGQAVASVEALAHKMRAAMREPAIPKARDLLLGEGGHAILLGGLRQDVAKAESNRDQGDSGIPNPRLEFLRDAIAAFEELSAEDILVQIETLHTDRLKWRESIAQGCDRIAAMLGKSNPDAMLDQRHWDELIATFEGKSHTSLNLLYRDWGSDDEGSRLFLLETRDTAAIEPPPGIGQIAIDTYLDPATRGILPEDYIAAHEPVWRTLVDNIPHRMGGYHDGVQSGSDEMTTGEVLLLQLNSDDAMDWCWGDVGAYYFWIKHSDLAAMNFAEVDLILECH